MRKPFIAGNWKMNKTVDEAVELVRQLKENLKDVGDDREIAVCPPFTAIYAVAKELQGSNIKVGAQDVFYEDWEAYTGEISPLMLKDLGVEYVIVGHSERRHIIGEDCELINKKVHALLKHGLKPILCVGELLEEREAGKTEIVVQSQVIEGFKGVSKEEALNITIAYEPVWAIGTGKTATPEDADKVHKFIRDVLNEFYDDPEIGEKIRIQYGGSVKPENVDGLMAMPNIDGALVGGASLKADSFTRIVKFQK